MWLSPFIHRQSVVGVVLVGGSARVAPQGFSNPENLIN